MPKIQQKVTKKTKWWKIKQLAVVINIEWKIRATYSWMVDSNLQMQDNFKKNVFFLAKISHVNCRWAPFLSIHISNNLCSHTSPD